MSHLLWIAVAGALGTLARYGVTAAIPRISGIPFPLGVLTVNALGSLLAGLLWGLFEQRWHLASEARLLLVTGFLGAFTTFSAMMLETGHLLRSGHWGSAACYLALQQILGIAALFAGVFLTGRE